MKNIWRVKNIYLILATTGHDDVGVGVGRPDESVVGGLDVVLVLLEDAVNIPTSIGDIPLQPPRQPDVRVRVDEHLHVEHGADVLVVEGEDALEYDDVGTVH